MQKAERTLRVVDSGVASHKFAVVVHNFIDQPLCQEFFSDKKDNSLVLGFRGEGSKFWMGVEPFGNGRLVNRGKAKGETEVYLYFECDYDIKMHVEWSASITDPLGKALATSGIRSTVLEKDNGIYKKSPFVVMVNGAHDVRMVEDPNFGLRKDIMQNGWLFDGSLHVAVDLRFKVLGGGSRETTAPLNPFLSALKNQLDNPLFPDCTLISADGVQIRTHKLILSLQSPVFQAMFENDLEEHRTGICKIEDANAEPIKAMLKFLVGVELTEWSFDLARDLYELGDKYELVVLRNRSAVELSKALTTKNLVDILLLAYRHSETALMNEAFYFLEDNMNEAVLDGVMDRLVSDEVPKALVREWRIHLHRRQKGVEMEESDHTKGESISNP